MSERLRESVSALVDGEVEELELRRLLASDDFSSVRTAWGDYQRVSDGLAGADLRFAHLDISGRVMAAIESETGSQQARSAPRWWRPVASVAVAASMAAVVVVGVRGFGEGDQAPAQVAVMESSPAVGKVFPATSSSRVVGNVAVGAQFTGQPGVQAVSLSPDEIAREQLERYMLRHTERAALSNGQGLISFARVTRLETE